MPSITMNFELTEKDHQKLLEEAKEQVRAELTTEAVEKYIQENQRISMRAVASNFGAHQRYDALKHKTVDQLTDDEKLICALNWLMYERLN